eukprot:NODE_73_length_23464_cov_0.600171.p1 type:complete len:4313 gc:universal NODE_73_length_23464_cov_0.600171:23064-10126(-)
MDSRWQLISNRILLVHGQSVKTDLPQKILQFFDGVEKLCFITFINNELVVSKQFVANQTNIYVIKDSELTVGVLHGNQFEAALAIYKLYGQLVGNEQVKLQLEKSGKYLENMIERSEFNLETTDVISLPLKELERKVEGWCHELELIMLESDQLQRQDEEISGPRAELIYWQHREHRFQAIKLQLCNPGYIEIKQHLYDEVSPVYEHLVEIEAKMKFNFAEAKDNVVFLAPLDKHSQLLGQLSYESLNQAIPVIMNIIHVIYISSKYFCTPDRITSLLIKVTNEVLVSIKKILTKKLQFNYFKDSKVYCQDLPRILEIYKNYSNAYLSVKKKLDLQDELPKFDFSEMYIFGRLEAFTKRLNRVVEFCCILATLSTFNNVHIDGFGPTVKKYMQLESMLMLKQTNVLDYKKTDFDLDMAYLNLQASNLMHDTLTQLTIFVNDYEDFKFVLVKMEQLKAIKDYFNLDFNDYYDLMFHRFAVGVLNNVKHHVDIYKDDLHTSNGSYTVNKLKWVKSMIIKIQQPLELILTYKDFNCHPDYTIAMKQYNRLMTALIVIESKVLEAWQSQIEFCLSSLDASLFVIDERNTFYLNLDVNLHNYIIECEYMKSVGIEIPNVLFKLTKRWITIESVIEKLKCVVADRNSLTLNHWTPLKDFYSFIAKWIDNKLALGLISITWNSFSIVKYTNEIYYYMCAIGGLKQNVNDIVSNVLEPLQNSLSKIIYIDVQTERIVLREYRHAMAIRMNKCVKIVEDLLLQTEYVAYLIKNALEQLLKQLNLENDDLLLILFDRILSHLKSIVLDSLVISIRQNMEDVKVYLNSDCGCINIDFDVDCNELIIKPNLNTVQSDYIDICTLVLVELSSFKNPLAKTTAFKDWSVLIANKEVQRFLSSMSIYSKNWKSLIVPTFKVLEEYLYIILLNTTDELLKYKETTVHELESVLIRTRIDLHSVEQISDHYSSGPFIQSTIELKKLMINKLLGFQSLIGCRLNELLNNNVNNLVDQLGQYSAKLNSNIDDFEDVKSIVDGLTDFYLEKPTIEMKIKPIEEGFTILTKFNLAINKNTNDLADSIRYDFDKLTNTSHLVQSSLYAKESMFKSKFELMQLELEVESDKFQQDYLLNGPQAENIDPLEAIEKLQMFIKYSDNIERQRKRLDAGAMLFNTVPVDTSSENSIRKELKLLYLLYGVYKECIDYYSELRKLTWIKCDFKLMNELVSDLQSKFKKIPKSLKEKQAYLGLKTLVDDLVDLIPLLEQMNNPKMLPRHYNGICAITKVQCDFENDSPIGVFINSSTLLLKDDLEDICTGALKEHDIDSKLQAVVLEWTSKCFCSSMFKQRGLLILQPSTTAEIITSLEDSQMTLASLFSNRYNTPFKEDIQKWIRYLTITSEVLDNWLSVMNLWIYLEAVFGGGDIAKQMPKEAKKFQNVDKTWCRVMGIVNESPLIIPLCVDNETVKECLPIMMEQLEQCQKSLVGYLESKRRIFPRFYFVSDPSLLEILGQASDTHTIIPHLKSLFDNVNSVQFDVKEHDKIMGMESMEGEQVVFYKPLLATGNVEIWIGQLLECVKKSIQLVIKAAVTDMSEMDLINVIEKYPAQVGLLCLQISWTMIMEEAIASKDKKSMQNALARITIILNTLISTTTKDLSKMDRIKYETLITIQVHHRDVSEELTKLNVNRIDDFEWLKQSRFYYKEDEEKCIVSITNFDFVYQNEYLGCTDRLVITPLTDRCYCTLAQAIGLNLGGSPAGPAGTGKTETTKDMGKALGKWVVVFNCSDQMDYRGLGRIYKGLAQSGCWGCFDEFNRIELPVLSVAAQQIASVLNAKKEKKSNFIFTDGELVELNPEVGFFITMNPGYAGRVELPENLKVYFRYVAMMVPDRQIIIKVKLAGCGFINNSTLARKFFVLYKLCEEQLSKQVHYDFGLRNILSVLRTCGSVKRSNPMDSEETIMMRVLRDMNMSKLVDEDELVFSGLINDLFPSVSSPKGTYPEMEGAIFKAIGELNITASNDFTLKVIQLYETAKVRHGIMMLGPTGSGKSKIIQTLLNAFTNTNYIHKDVKMNPKAILDYQMFGRLDSSTNDWTDGIFSAIWRKTLKRKGENIWIILDGPVDAVWIENLNSVLDDNKTLTLANGDRLIMSPGAKLVFEVDSLRNASPATVSRCGMIYVGQSTLTWDSLLQSWLKLKLKQSFVLADLFNKTFNTLLEYIKNELHPRMTIPDISYFIFTSKMLDSILPNDKTDPEHINKAFVFAITWGFGSLLELLEREKLYLFIVDKFTFLLLPSKSNGYDYYLNNFEWQEWQFIVPDWEFPNSDFDYSTLFIPNIDNIRTQYLIQRLTDQNMPVMLIGEPGSAKTMTISKYIQSCSNEQTTSKTIAFSSTTSPNVFQRSIESIVEKRLGTTYGPPGGKKMMMFIDDVNMPEINNWGDQPTSEIVRQLMEQGGMYSLDRPGEWTSVIDFKYLAAMMHPGGGRNDVPARLKRQFCIINCALPSSQSIDKIFGLILNGYFSTTRGFAKDIEQQASSSIYKIRNIWQSTKNKLLPTPDKFHYIFNLRDLSRIVQGMTISKPSGLKTVAEYNNLMTHECSRVLSDRLVTEKDVSYFKQQVQVQNPSAVVRFCDFMRLPPEDTENEDYKYYEQCEDIDLIKQRLLNFQSSYNESVKSNKLDLVLFDDAIDHILRICRQLRTPRGSMVLVGVGGSGKQSLTKLSAFICDSKVFQLTITKNYNITNFMDDLKIMYRYCGVNGESATFIFTDNDVKDETYLGIINNILTNGEIPGLFLKDEILTICNDVRMHMKKESPIIVDTNENLYTFFIERVMKNLHVILCFSPVGDKFRQRSLKFPGLISGCTLDWFNKWPQAALMAVSSKFLSPVALKCTEEVKNSAIGFIAMVHQDIQLMCDSYLSTFRRKVYLTPKSYLSFLNSFIKMYSKKLNHVGSMAERMNVGLSKLNEAASSVAILQQELTFKEKELLVASKEADLVLQEVTESTHQAQVVKDEVLKVKLSCQEIADIIKKDKSIAEAELEAAKPALEEAANALNSIQPSHISAVRKLAKPPHLIMRIMDGVLLLQQKKLDTMQQDPEKPCCKPSWQESMKLMSTPDFLQSLLKFPKDEMTEETVELVEPYIEMADFTVEGAKKVSADVAGLACWVRAMCTYYHINKKVIPLKSNLIVAEHKYSAAMYDLSKAQAILDEKEHELSKLKKKYDDAIDQKQQLQDVADLCRKKMRIATMLINGLQGEKERWTTTAKDLERQIGKLVGDVIIASAFLSYCGPFNFDYRHKMMCSWKIKLNEYNIPSSDFNLQTFMLEQNTLDEWQLNGLPNDELSVQNGIITTEGSRYPLIIDPQSQARQWISKKEGKNLIITNFSNKYFRNNVEDAVNLGRPLLIEDVEEYVDPSLDNILERNLLKSGKGFKVMFGEKELDYTSGFRLYMTTKLPNPSYTPEVFAKLSVVDFTVTQRGLEEQLLGRVILREKKELEIERVKLLEEISMNKKKIKDLEDNLLSRLSSTKGSLVDDESLVVVLENTKKTSVEVNDKLIVAADTNKKITHARDEYRVIAIRGSIIYFLISDFANVCNMYQTSLGQFLQLFDESMDRSKVDVIVQKRIENILDYLTFRLFSYFTRGLYEKHKLMFSLLLSLKIDLNRNKISIQEFNLFIRAGQLSVDTTKKPYSWISDSIWLNLTAIRQLLPFHELVNNIENNEKQWKSWYEHDEPELLDTPNMELSAFHHMLLIRCFCIDKVLGMSRKYISSTLGNQFVQPQLLNLQELLSESSVKTPMIALLTSGSDPTSDIECLSKQLKIPLVVISMGQGQEVHARKHIKLSMLQGGWVLLQNCHLGLPFMDELMGLLDDCNDQFRLWITTEQNAKFPINLLQISIKFTNEPPQGLKAGLMRTYSWLTNEQLDANYKEFPLLIYILCLFHTIVQERRKYGSIGWIIPYEFNQADLLASIMCIQMIFDQLDPKSPIPWQTIRYMVGDVHYGGRVTNNMDRKFIQTLTMLLFNDLTIKSKMILGVQIHGFKTVDLYINQLQILGDQDLPNQYGLSGNNNIIFHTNYVTGTLESITNIQPQESVLVDREMVLRQLIDQSRTKLPMLIKYEAKKFSKAFVLFIQHELQVFNSLITRIDKDLSNLIKVLDGSSLMTTQTQQLMDNILCQVLPKDWQQIPCQSYSLFFIELQQRQVHYINWMQNKLAIIHMPYIFQPQSLLTTIQQEMSRNNKWALDSTTITCEVAKNLEHAPNEGLYIGGLTIECGQYDRRLNQFVELTGKQLTSVMPVLHITATNQTVSGQVPVYRTSKRHELICLLNLKWSDQLTVKGTGIVCNSDLK